MKRLVNFLIQELLCLESVSEKDFIIRFPFANALGLNHYKSKLDFTPSLKTLFKEPTEGLPFKLCSALSHIITKYQFYKICCLISLLLNNGAFHMRNINTVFYLYMLFHG